MDMGNFSRLFNHSCAPNLEIRLIVQPGESAPRVAFFTKTRVIVGDELTWSYSPAATGKVECRCGAATCRKWL